MYFGAPVWPIKWAHPYDGTIKRIAELGFKGVELIGWTGQVFDEYYTKDTIAELKKLIDSLGLTLTNFNHNLHYLACEDKKLQADNMESYRKAVNTAAALGSKSITSVAPYPFAWRDIEKDGLPPQILRIRHVNEVQVWTINADLNKDWKGMYDQYVGYIRQCCELAGAAGLKVLIEPHPYRMVNSASSMLRLIEHVGADNLGMNFDPSHLFPSGDMPQVTVYQLGDRIGHTHFSDNDTTSNVHWRPGKGKIDWYAVMKALKDVGYDGAINLELEDVPGAVTPDAATATGTNNSMEVELKLGMEYISEICKSLGISI